MRAPVVASTPRAVLGLLIAAIVACLLSPTPAHASGDIGCSVQRKLRHHDFSGCDDMAMLSQGNDTRVNLVLLLARGDRRAPTKPRDVRPPGPLFDWPTFESWTVAADAAVGDDTHAAGEGSRCLSDTEGKAAFAAALETAKGMKAPEKAALIAARRDLHPTCNDANRGTVAVAPVPATSRAGKDFAIYLQGASAFYAGDFAAATARFAALDRSSENWLRETSRYMLARVEVNRAQVGLFDEYGARDDKRKVDRQTVTAAENGLRAYLRAYPAGRYAASARGLLRRVYWLGGDTAKLAAEYAALFAQSPDARGLDDASLAEEIDAKLLPQLTSADTTDPTLLAVLDLQAMRGDDKDAADKTSLTREALAAQRSTFASQPALFDFLLATRAFYMDKDYRTVLQLVGDAARQPSFDTLQFSRQMLRGMALDATGDRNARGFWLEMMPGTVQPFQRTTLELALALHDERTAGLDRVFAAGSPIRDETIRDVLVANAAGAALLRRQAAAGISPHERTAALFTLLYKDITRGAYRDFVADVAAVPADAPDRSEVYEFVGSSDPPVGIFTRGSTKEGFACPGLRESAARLAGNPRASDARLCVAEFVRLHGLDGYFLDQPPPADELGGAPSLFPGRAFSRLETYKAVIATPGAPAPDKAYALFRAINCYAPSQANGCGGEDVAPAVRKGWFQRLHREFPASRWAQESVYYW